jgi:glyoxylase-like metal-dependent hydrolase (beta-lactamase superfamily II)
MRTLLFLPFFLITLLVGTSGAVTAQEAGQIPVTVRRLSERVAVFDAEGLQTTHIVAVASEQGVVVIDTEISPTLTAAVRAEIERTFAAPVRWLVLTHGHGDHAFGSQVFADVPIVAHRGAFSDLAAAGERIPTTIAQLRGAVSALTARRAETSPEDEAYRSLTAQIVYYERVAEGLETGFTLTLPTVTFDERMSLDLGDLTLELTWYGTAHSQGDLLIWCPEEGLLATGDLFYPGQEVYIDTDRVPYLERWADCLEQVLVRGETVRHIVSGHDEPASLTDLETLRREIRVQQSRFQGRGSARDAFLETLETDGLEAALTRLKECAGRPDDYYVLHPELDSYAFGLMREGDLDTSLRILEVLAGIFPEAWMAWDSLGEVHLARGEREAAIAAFEHSLALDPENRNAIRRLEERKKAEGLSGR